MNMNSSYLKSFKKFINNYKNVAHAANKMHNKYKVPAGAALAVAIPSLIAWRKFRIARDRYDRGTEYEMQANGAPYYVE